MFNKTVTTTTCGIYMFSKLFLQTNRQFPHGTKVNTCWTIGIKTCTKMTTKSKGVSITVITSVFLKKVFE